MNDIFDDNNGCRYNIICIGVVNIIDNSYLFFNFGSKWDGYIN